MTQDIRDRLRGLNPDAINTAEAEGNKDKAREREMGKWFGQYGAKKPMKSFEGVLKEIAIEERGGVRGDGTEWTGERVVSYWDDVLCYEGQASPTTEFNYPGDGKTWNRNSEGAVMTRKAIENNPEADIKDYYDLIGKRLKLTGNWEPTFLGDANASGQRFWNGVYYYDIEILGDAAKKVSAPDPADVQKLAEFCIGKTPADVKNLALGKYISSVQTWIDEPALNSLVMESQGSFLKYAVDNGLLALVDGVYVDPTAAE